MTIHLVSPLPTRSSDLPGNSSGPPLTFPYLVLLQAGFTKLPPSPAELVSSYLTFSPLPLIGPLNVLTRGGFLSVALSFPSPGLGVTQRFVLWSPDFPPPCQRHGRRSFVLLRHTRVNIWNTVKVVDNVHPLPNTSSLHNWGRS